MPISIFTPLPQSSDELESIHGVAVLEVLDARFDGAVQGGPLFVIEVVAATSEHLINGHQLDDLAFGQVGGLIEDEPAIVDMGPEGLHHQECNPWVTR